MKETDLMRACMMEASRLGAVVWRNNVGVLRDHQGRPVRYGLCVGSSDIIGIYRGRFVAIEVKTDSGRLSPDQEKFLQAVSENGGIAGIARGVEDIKKLLT